jgi:hypothetical protein
MGVRWHFDAVHEPGGVHFIIAADSLRSPLNSISLGSVILDFDEVFGRHSGPERRNASIHEKGLTGRRELPEYPRRTLKSFRRYEPRMMVSASPDGEEMPMLEAFSKPHNRTAVPFNGGGA